MTQSVENTPSPKSDGKKKEAEKDKFETYEVEDAMRTLLRAEEIKVNKKLLTAVLEKLGQQKASITSLEELRSVAREKVESEDKDE